MASKRKKTLADELAELVNPAPVQEVDPELVGFDGALLHDVSDEEDEQQPAAERSGRKVAEKPRMRAAIDLEDVAYRGRKTTAAKAFGEDLGGSEDGEDGEEDADEGEEEDSDGGMDDFLESDDGDEGEQEEDEDEEVEEEEEPAAGPSGRGDKRGKKQSGAAKRSGVQAEGSSDEGDDDEEEEEEGDDDDEEEEAGPRRKAAPRGGRDAGGADEDELRALEREYADMAVEEREALATMRQRSGKEVAKGQAVRNQQVLYGSALEARIHLQRVLQGAHRLPRPATTTALLAAQEPQLKQLQDGFTALQQGLSATLSQLLELQDALMARHVALGPGMAKLAGAKRPRDPEHITADEAWELLQQRQAVVAPFRDAALDRWHRRTVLASGSAALRSSNLRALNQSISSQVAAVLRDPVKFIRRSQMALHVRPRPLGEPREEQQQQEAAGPSGAEQHADGEHVSASEARDGGDEARDPETYDDSEFYQQLLKELLDKGGAAGAGAIRPQGGAKKRKVVDRRASKGRKIRYNVHDKLVNFMAPVDMEPPPFAAQLFANLFGHDGR